jgi:hypothetical protein
MKHHTPIVAAVVMFLFLPACSQSAKEVPPAQVTMTQEASAQPKGRTESTLVEVRAKVQSVNYKKRLITFKTADGKIVTFKAGDEVKRLNDVKAGDTVLVQYAESLAFEVREPTADEKKNPTMALGAGGRAEPGTPPAAAAVSAIHSIVTVEAIDRSAGTVTVKGPKGGVVTVKAQDPKNLEKLKLGDTIAVTYTEAVAISVEPGK